jgi:4-hydroxyphenylpyruvate dioxygenase
MQPNAPLPIREIDHIEFWVGNARQAATYYRLLFGFDQIAYRGPETGTRGKSSYLLRQGNIRFILTTTLMPDDEISRHVARHGDGVRDVVLAVDDARACFEEAVRRGATAVMEPRQETGRNGAVVRAAVATWGDTIHSFLQRESCPPPILPDFEEAFVSGGGGTGVVAVDHLVGNVDGERMDDWVEFYKRVFGFSHFLTFDDKDISTDYSALRSKVVVSDNGKVKFPINEPAAGRSKSQIQEYLDYYHGPGVQHIALLTGDALGTVAELRRRGVEFLEVPNAYYESMPERVGRIEEDVERIRDLRILVDRDDRGYLLQLFTKPVEDRPTLFFEVIQRRGSQGFGRGNFRALFEAIEREQARRGNL